MMDMIGTGLQESGIMTERIHSERFTPGELNADETAYRITLEGHEAFEFKGAPTLLHGLEQAKIAVESDCRAGHCGVCRIKVLDGNVRWLSPKETKLAEDEILSCCVTPQSDLRLARP
jgi:ferredoxin